MRREQEEVHSRSPPVLSVGGWAGLAWVGLGCLGGGAEQDDLPGGGVGCDLQAAGIANELVQDADDLLKLWPVVAVLLPAVQHQLVECGGTVHRRGQSVALVHRFDHLQPKQKQERTKHRIIIQPGILASGRTLFFGKVFDKFPVLDYFSGPQGK